jgi:hypothetical protein
MTTLERYGAAPTGRRQWLVGDLSLLLVHSAHLSTALIRLSTLANASRSTKRFIEALGDISGHPDRVAALAKSVVAPTKRLLKLVGDADAVTEAKLRTLFVSFEAMSAVGAALCANVLETPTSIEFSVEGGEAEDHGVAEGVGLRG